MQPFVPHPHRLAVLVAVATTLGMVALLMAVMAAAGFAAPSPVTGLASPTHPNATRWYSNSDPEFTWPGSPVAVPAIAGYSYVLDQVIDTVPDTTTELPVKAFGVGPRTDFGTGFGPNAIAISDFNGDGRRDLVTVDNKMASITILIGNGDGTFPAVTDDYDTATEPGGVVVGDVNSDRIPDVVTKSWSDCSVSVFLGSPTGVFGARTDIDFGTVRPFRIAMGDFNRDGRRDLVTANNNEGTVSVLLGRGDGTFRTKKDFPAGVAPLSVAVGDFNGDRRQDLATANYSGASIVSVLLGRGDGTFRARTDFATGDYPQTVAVGDFNGDGRPDLVTSNIGADSVAVLLGEGDGTFAAKTEYGVGAYPQDVVCGDLDGDGAQDLVTANLDDDTVSLLLGKGDGSFGPKTDVAVGDGPASVAMGDLDGDGLQDLVTPNYNAYTVSVLLNDANHAAFGGKADGVWYFHVRSVDTLNAGGPTTTRAVCIDTVAPSTKAPYRSTVRRGQTATLRYKVVDPRPGSPTATVAIFVRTLRGKTVKTLRYSSRPVNRLLSARFVCRLRKGRYRFAVIAGDQAGNDGGSSAGNILRVR